jgi:hypothetical protein
MVYYMGEVRKEAVDFIGDCFDDVLSAFENDEDRLFDESGVDDAFWESVIDRSYSLSDAAFVIENSNNVESDSGLWDGKDPAEALETQAAFTYGNDVRNEVEEIYEDLKMEFDSKKTEVYDELEEKNINSEDDEDDDYDPEEDALESAKIYIKEYFDETYEEGEIPKVTSIGIRYE